jgi:uncharacterized protein
VKIKSFPGRVKAAGEEDGMDAGVFEALVSVFGNRDSYGDIVMKGAFADTLAEWKASGDPIPVIWSHLSHDPDYHIGKVLDAEERDEGLWVKGQIDLDEDTPKARRVYKLLKGRRVKQFSFAYDVIDGAWVKADGVDSYELRKMKLHEVGPTLLGVNQETQLLGIKSGLACPTCGMISADGKAMPGPATPPPAATETPHLSPASITSLLAVDALAYDLDLMK